MTDLTDIADLPAVDGVWTPPARITARELCALNRQPPPPVLGDLIRAGQRVVIAGPSGHGKTTMTLAIAKAVADGTEFLGWEGAGGPVVILELEQGEWTIRLRLVEAGLDQSDDVIYYRAPDGLALDSNHAQIDWIEQVVQQERPVMLIIDPLYKAHRGDSNEERAMVDLLRRLDALRERYRFSLLIPAHARKVQTAGRKRATLTMDDVYGSEAILRGAEVVLGVMRLMPGRSRLFFFKDRDGTADVLADEAWDLDFDRTLGYRRRVRDVFATTVQGRLLTYMLRAGENVCRKDVEVTFNTSSQNASHMLKRAKDQGYVKVAAVGERGQEWYSVTEAGYAMLHAEEDDDE